MRQNIMPRKVKMQRRNGYSVILDGIDIRAGDRINVYRFPANPEVG
jgi:hypothetical protein